MNNKAVLTGIQDKQGYNNQNHYNELEAIRKYVEQGWEAYGKENFSSYEEYLESLENEDWAASNLQEEAEVISRFYQQ